jgi:hypothetical protein
MCSRHLTLSGALVVVMWGKRYITNPFRQRQNQMKDCGTQTNVCEPPTEPPKASNPEPTVFEDTGAYLTTFGDTLLQNVETLQFMRFKRRAAERIYEEWAIAARISNDVEFFRFATRPIVAAADATATGDDWDAALKEMGMNRITREGILEPEFTHIRLSRSAQEWTSTPSKWPGASFSR